jgi:hypothetical protein
LSLGGGRDESARDQKYEDGRLPATLAEVFRHGWDCSFLPWTARRLAAFTVSCSFFHHFPEALRLFLEWLQPSEPVVLATWSHYDLWQLDLDLENHGLPKLAIPFLDVKKLAARSVGSKRFDATLRELAPDAVTMPRHRAIADARLTARILYRLLRPAG